MITVGTGYRLMSTVSFTVQPSIVLPVTIYSVLTSGVATGLLIIVLFKPAAGVHDQAVNVLLAESCTGVLGQASSTRSASTSGIENRLMVTESLTAQPSVVAPVTIYFVLTSGVATGLLMVVFVNPAAGVHDQFASVLLAANCTGVLGHASRSRSVITVGNVNRFTSIVSLTAQPSVVVAFTIYSVLTAGVATGLLIVVLVNPAAGVHDQAVKVLLAVICTGMSGQVFNTRSAITVGMGSTFMFTVSFA